MTTLSGPAWRQLPFEVEEQILSFLPVHELCRYLTVCRRWHSLICRPEFRAIYVGNVAKPGNRVSSSSAIFGSGTSAVVGTESWTEHFGLEFQAVVYNNHSWEIESLGGSRTSGLQPCWEGAAGLRSSGVGTGV